jgi:hypothetical protein
MRPKASIFILLWPALLLLTANAQADLAWVRPELPTYEIEPDSTITVPIYLENAADVYAIDVRASFDPFLVEVVDADPDQDGVQIEPGQFPQPDLVVIQDVDTQAGTIHYVMTQINPASPANGDGVLFIIHFRGRGAAAETFLRIDQVEMSDRSGLLLPVQWEGADLVVDGESRSDPIILPTGVAIPTSSGSQADPATATSDQPASTSSQVPPSATETTVATATKVLAEMNPTGEPSVAVVQAPEQAASATKLSTAPDPEQAVSPSSVDSKPGAEEPSPDNSDNEIVPTPISTANADSEPQVQVNMDSDSLSQAAPADTQIAQTEFSKVNSLDFIETSESLTVVGENVTVPSPAKPMLAGSDSNSPMLVLTFIAIGIILFVGIAVFLFLRRSS